MKRLPLDTVLSLMRRENVLGHGFDLDELVQIFVKHVKDTLSQEQVELSLAHYLAKSKHNDVVHRNEVLAKVTQFLNQYGWQLSDYHADYYKKYLPLFR
ncbi:hypothetical protein NYE69_11660 [Paenibacillus sp. FSL R5-0527]|uniref:hypothetical protein n=1 Tax=Paenibacillaceae TaxID=186822 RepID=UPI00097B5EA3|nr:hypothetical protein [Salmonella enterica]MCM3079735.1 hypothetical protein [Brevibacillus invocatus]MCM3429929.1 hypothetical protein [Brevibacillus invocatus]OMG50471.1 hypothetical protein BK140_05970 [Paenibacillus macerans]